MTGMDMFDLVTRIADQEGALPIRDKVWTCKVDEQWTFKINGHKEEMEKIPAFHMFVEYNGWPAGLVSSYGGIIAAGNAANEQTFIDALNKKLSILEA